MSGPTQGMGQQNGDCQIGGQSIAEVKAWEFTPTQKVGEVVTNATGGYQGQIMGALGGFGTVTIVIPKTGYTAPIPAGKTTLLNLYADLNQEHGYENVPAVMEKKPVKIELNSENAIEMTINFKANGPYNAIGAFALM